MKIEDLVKGEVYKCIYSNTEYIFEYNNSSSAYFLCNSNFSKSGWGFWRKDKNIQLATPLEKAHLLECIKQNKFVPLKDIKITQEIQWLWN